MTRADALIILSMLVVACGVVTVASRELSEGVLLPLERADDFCRDTLIFLYIASRCSQVLLTHQG